MIPAVHPSVISQGCATPDTFEVEVPAERPSAAALKAAGVGQAAAKPAPEAKTPTLTPKAGGGGGGTPSIHKHPGCKIPEATQSLLFTLKQIAPQEEVRRRSFSLRRNPKILSPRFHPSRVRWTRAVVARMMIMAAPSRVRAAKAAAAAEAEATVLRTTHSLRFWTSATR